MSWESSVSFFIAILIFGVTPGPGVFAIMARALMSGAGSCFYLALGMTISDIFIFGRPSIFLLPRARGWFPPFAVVSVAACATMMRQ